jgi:superfamily II DNA or RNA helicase
MAIAAIARRLQEQGNVLVVVPSIALQRQWAESLQKFLPEHQVYLVGGDGARIPPHGARLIVGVVNSVSKHWFELPWVDTVVADECHNYGAATFRRALLPWAERRMGITATLERMDEGVEEVLEPYFRGKAYECDFARAHQDGRIASARIALVGVSFNEDDETEYEDVCDTMSGARSSLLKRFGLPEKPFGEFMKQVGALAASPGTDPASMTARRYLQARNRRSELLAECPAKTALVTDLAPEIAQAGGTLVFSERIDAANTASAALTRRGLRAPAYHSEIIEPLRERLLGQLREGQIDALCSAKALDEGIDVPEVTLGVIVAGTQQKRQMVQRLGRILRPKKDGSPGRFIIAYVHGTLEDPAEGAHEGFLELARKIPGSIRVFDSGRDAGSIQAFLDGDGGVGDPLPSGSGKVKVRKVLDGSNDATADSSQAVDPAELTTSSAPHAPKRHQTRASQASTMKTGSNGAAKSAEGGANASTSEAPRAFSNPLKAWDDERLRAMTKERDQARRQLAAVSEDRRRLAELVDLKESQILELLRHGQAQPSPSELAAGRRVEQANADRDAARSEAAAVSAKAAVVEEQLSKANLDGEALRRRLAEVETQLARAEECVAQQRAQVSELSRGQSDLAQKETQRVAELELALAAAVAEVDRLRQIEQERTATTAEPTVEPDGLRTAEVPEPRRAAAHDSFLDAKSQRAPLAKTPSTWSAAPDAVTLVAALVRSDGDVHTTVKMRPEALERLGRLLGG